MDGRSRIESAFAHEGASAFGAVICYEGIFVRDHWAQLTDCPWWYRHSPDIRQQMRWRRDVIQATGQDWFVLPDCPPRRDRTEMRLDAGAEGVFLVEGDTKRRIPQPQVGGWSVGGGVESVHPARPAGDEGEIDALIPLADGDPGEAMADGRGDLAAALLSEFGDRCFPIRHVLGPLWSCYQLWGFEGWMTMVAERPDLVHHACHRFLANRIQQIHLAAAMGAAGIWIEDCMTDMVGPRAFAELNVPFLAEMVAEMRNAGLRSVYYFCGDPTGKWDHLLAVGADALSLEESKKGFRIDIEEVVERTQGRSVVLGNLDAIHLLPSGSDDELSAEIHRQLAAGRRNGGRFFMSLGSPVTPGTHVGRVRRYSDLVHSWTG